MVTFLVQNANAFEAKLATIELLLSDPTVQTGQDRFRIIPEHDPRARSSAPVDQHDAVDPAREAEVTRACTEWFSRCRPDGRDHMLFYGCSHGVADRDSEGLMVLEDVRSSAFGAWKQVLNVRSIAIGVPARLNPGGAWFFLDACQELLPEIVDQIGGLPGIRPIEVGASERARHSSKGGVRPLVLGTSFGMKTFAEDSGVAFFTQALLAGIERYCFERRNRRFLVTGRKLALGLADLSLSLFRRELQVGGLGNENAQVSTALCEVCRPEVLFHITWETQPRGLADVAPLGLYAAGNPDNVIALRDNEDNGDQWTVSQHLPQNGVTVFAQRGPARIENTIVLMDPPVIRHDICES
jgi:hypothetical protein